MKKIMLKLPILLVAIALLSLNSCKKDNSGDDSQSAKDATALSNSLNSTSNDVDVAAGQVQGMSGKTDGGAHLNFLCNSATVTSIDSVAKKIILGYNGSFSCNGVIETGTVTVQLTSGTHWRDQNAVLTVTITNLQFTDVATNGSYTLNGAYTITNENGGLLYELFAGISSAPIARRHQTVASSPLTITFADGTQRTWTFDRTRTFTSINGGYINVELSTEATDGVSMTGTNRYGDVFKNMITVPIQATNNPGCLWKPWTGTWEHTVANRSATIKFGTDINGTQVGTEGNCVTGEGYFITFTHKGKVGTKFVEYGQ